MPLPRDTPDLPGLDLLVAIADEGGIAAAARVLAVSQPTASDRLRILERRLGLTLVVRTPTGSVPTAAGAAVVEWARPVLDGAAVLVDGVRALRGQAASRLSVSASLTVAEHLVPGWLVTLAAETSDVSVALRMGNSTDVVAAVRQGSVQLGFVEGASAPKGLRSRTILRDELVLIVAPGHPWARRRTPVGAAELSATALVMREEGSGTREVLEQWMDITGHEPRAAVELASTTALVHAVRAGVGPAVVSALAVSEELGDGRLVRVPLRLNEGAAAHLHRRIRAVWRGPGPLTPAAARLVTVALASLPRAAGTPQADPKQGHTKV